MGKTDSFVKPPHNKTKTVICAVRNSHLMKLEKVRRHSIDSEKLSMHCVDTLRRCMW